LSVCINGKLGNMNLQEAARLTAQLQPRQVLPMHWGLFAENTLDPLEFARLVEKEATRSQVLIPEPGVPVAL
jgi:L-ascorbate 6-phosphate lactonase